MLLCHWDFATSIERVVARLHSPHTTHTHSLDSKLTYQSHIWVKATAFYPPPPPTWVFNDESWKRLDVGARFVAGLMSGSYKHLSFARLCSTHSVSSCGEY